ncbi:MAG: hypothetical protein IPK79_05975 [Vampirovibrionales bacterium]|nr:hypothetical protein [Vampirovibrionales bacterium]
MTAHSGLDRLYISAQQPSPEMPWRWAASRPAASTPTSKYVAYRVAAHLGQWIRGWQSQVFVDKRFPKSGVMEYHDDPLSDRQILELIERVGERIGERVGRVALEKP